MKVKNYGHEGCRIQYHSTVQYSSTCNKQKQREHQLQQLSLYYYIDYNCKVALYKVKKMIYSILKPMVGDGGSCFINPF